MFGLFKKPDAKKSIYECLEVWDMLTDRDKLSSAQNILKYARELKQNCVSRSDALMTIGQLKQGVIKQYGLSDHVHPAYMQLQILSDYIFSKSQDLPVQLHGRMALEKLTSPLSKTEQSELIQQLDKLV
jgi:hypothetical protein